MNEMMSADELAEAVNDWCDEHGISPANGQTGERMTVRNVRYYRTLGLIDAPALGGGQGFGEKHRLQLIAIRLLQAQGLPLSRIQELLFGRSIEELKQIEKKGLVEMAEAGFNGFRPGLHESWSVAPLNEEFMLVSRRGRRLSAELRERLLGVLQQEEDKEAPFAGSRNKKRSNP
jgi:DNA-binding transcriptional MerR regulator